MNEEAIKKYNEKNTFLNECYSKCKELGISITINGKTGRCSWRDVR